MKYIRIFTTISILGLCLFSCQEKVLTGDSRVHIHLQGGLNDDEVKIAIDGNQVYHKQHVTTNNLLGLADVDSTVQQNGDHSIRLDINSNVTHSENFTLENTKWLGINLNPNDSSVTIIYSDYKFLYD